MPRAARTHSATLSKKYSNPKYELNRREASPRCPIENLKLEIAGQKAKIETREWRHENPPSQFDNRHSKIANTPMVWWTDEPMTRSAAFLVNCGPEPYNRRV